MLVHASDSRAASRHASLAYTESGPSSNNCLACPHVPYTVFILAHLVQHTRFVESPSSVYQNVTDKHVNLLENSSTEYTSRRLFFASQKAKQHLYTTRPRSKRLAKLHQGDLNSIF